MLKTVGFSPYIPRRISTMKKALMVLLAVAIVGAFAYAADPAPAFSIAEFTGNASVTLNVDLDNSAIAFSNSTAADIKLQFCPAGDKITAGEGTWAELKIKTDGDPIGMKIQGTKISDYAAIAAGDPFYGFKVVVDVAKIHFGPNLYLDIKAPGSTIDYGQIPDLAAPYMPYSGKYGATAGTVLLSDKAGAAGPSTVAAGATIDFMVPSVVEVAVSFGSPAWSDGTTAATGTSSLPDLTKNNFAALAKVALLAVPNLTLEAKASTGFGGVSQKYDMGIGAKVGYKLMLGDKYYLKPNVAFHMETPAGGTKSAMVLGAGVLFGFGGAKADCMGKTYFFGAGGSQDWGFYPGVAVSIQNYADNAGITGLGWTQGKGTSINVSAWTNADLVPGLKAGVAYEIDNLTPATGVTQKSGLSAVVTYALTADKLTITPKFGLNTYSDSLVTTNNTMFVKAGVDVAGLINNTTLSVQYDSNDMTTGLNNVATGKKDKLGKLAVTCKISF
jgi:hypothetical protein